MHKLVVTAIVVGLILFAGLADRAGALAYHPAGKPMAAEHAGHMHSEAADRAGADGTGRHFIEKDSLVRLVSIVSLLLVCCASLLFIVKIRRSRLYLPPMSGMMAAMSIGMLSSLLIGTMLGLMMAAMFVPTVIAVAAGMVSGHLSGQPYGLLASIDGMIAGVMGGMMGAMLGVMVAGEYPVLTVLFMDLIFIIFLLSLNALLKMPGTTK